MFNQRAKLDKRYEWLTKDDCYYFTKQNLINAKVNKFIKLHFF